MKTTVFLLAGMLASALVAPALLKPETSAVGGFTFSQVVPDDVFMFAAGRHNAERDFLDNYWGEVLQAIKDAHVIEDVTELFGSVLGLGPEQAAEVERIKERVAKLLDGVDWKRLIGTETVFAERLNPAARMSDQRPPIMIANMVVLSRSGDSAARNYEGVAAILEALVDEVNNAAGAELLSVTRTVWKGATVTSVDLLAGIPGAPALPLSVARRNDVVIIALQDALFQDVLALLNGDKSKKPIGDNPRFRAAFDKLPPSEDMMTFFDMQALLRPMRKMFDGLVDITAGPKDVYRNTGMSAEASKISTQASAAYQNGDIKSALDLVKKAHEVEPADSIITYNLACFSALAGHQKEALKWLGDAVEGGFYAPRKIASDADLKSLRDDPVYKAILEKADALAETGLADDIIVNSADTGETRSLTMQAWQAHGDNDYEQGLKLCQQAYAVAPKDSRVLYGLACFHALLGHERKALDFLEEAVEGGFHCPQHIAKDSDLNSIRGNTRFEMIATKAERLAGELAKKRGEGTKAVVHRLIDRLADAVGILDYVATVETTDGYSVRSESIAALVPDAPDRAIYPVFGNRPQCTDFDKYLPKETLSFSISGGLDFGELYKFLEDTIRLGGPEGEELLAKWSEVQKTVGVDVRRDILDWIDGNTICATLADGRGSLCLIKVKDEQAAREKVGAAIEFGAAILAELPGKNPAFAGLAMIRPRTSPIEHEKLEGFQNIHIGMSPSPVVWGVADGFLIFGTSVDAVTLCLAAGRGEHPNIRENPRAMSESLVPDGPFAGVSLTDQRAFGEELAAGFGIGSMLTGMAGAFVPIPEVRPVLGKISSILSKLMPVARKIDFFKSKATHVTFDGRAWHVRGVSHYFSPEERSARTAE